MIYKIDCRLLTFACLLLFTVRANAQSRIVTAGIEYKPIFPVSFLRTGTQSVTEGGVKYDFSLKSGFNAGMVIRKQFTDLLSFETGISYVKRTYSLSITDTIHVEGSQFRVIGYEI